MWSSPGNKDILLESVPAGSFWPLQRLSCTELSNPAAAACYGGYYRVKVHLP